MMKIRTAFIPSLLVMLISIMMVSCVPQGKIKYLQDTQGELPKTAFENLVSDYRIQPGDYLYIRLFSMDNEANKIFSDMNGGSTYANTTEQSVYLNSYLVNDSGYVSFPLLGRIKAGGAYITEIEKQLYDLMLNEINNPGVVVRLVNYKITVIGEVKNPGTYTVNQNRVSVFQALSMAGDLTTYSNRNSIKLLRKKDEQTFLYTLDLTKKDILSSEYYYLRPGDILYIEPLKNKQYAFETFPYALLLSSLSTVMALLTFFKI
jgi:polysaccharide export outer membrane protein